MVARKAQGDIPAIEAEKQLWYTAANAAKKLTQNSGRDVQPDYVRRLAKMGKVATWKIGERSTLYLKKDIDAYTVEERAAKANRRKLAQEQPRQQKARRPPIRRADALALAS